MGHTGTLDPLATWCLLIATENSTKLISRLENNQKTYLFTVDISITSPSLDLGTETDDVSIEDIEDHSYEEIITFLQNQTSQLPPKYSAIHISGKRAYDLVRAWKEFEITKRSIQVSHIEIVDKKLPKITIRLTISSGGYIRSFWPIIGNFFGTNWWCITSLCREYIGNLSLKNCQYIDTFDSRKIIPYNKLFPQIKEYSLDPCFKKKLIDGVKIDIGSDGERKSWEEILIQCDEIRSIGRWTSDGIEIIRNYV